MNFTVYNEQALHVSVLFTDFTLHPVFESPFAHLNFIGKAQFEKVSSYHSMFAIRITYKLNKAFGIPSHVNPYEFIKGHALSYTQAKFGKLSTIKPSKKISNKL